MRETVSNVLVLLMTAVLVGCATTEDQMRTFEAGSPQARTKAFVQTFDKFSSKANPELAKQIQELETILRSKTIREQKSRPATRYNYSCVLNGKRSTRSSPFGTDCVQVAYQGSDYYYESRKITADEESRFRKQFDRARQGKALLATVAELQALINHVIAFYPNDLEMRSRINDAYGSMLAARNFASADLSIFALSNGLSFLCYDADEQQEKTKDTDPRLISLCAPILKSKGK